VSTSMRRWRRARSFHAIQSCVRGDCHRIQVQSRRFRCKYQHRRSARSDDLLASQVLGTQLEHDLSGTAEVVASLNPEPKILVSKSKFTNCSLVRCDTPSLSYSQGRRREMDEIEHLLKQDLRFCSFASGLKLFTPGKERDDWVFDFYRGVYRHHNFKEDQALFNERCSLMCRYITLHDERCSLMGPSQERLGCMSFRFQSWMGTQFLGSL
jgi:hypothetical protein